MEAEAGGQFVLRVCLLLAMWVVMLTTWVDAPVRPPTTAASWEVESFATQNRQFHIVMSIHLVFFLFALTMLVVSWYRG